MISFFHFFLFFCVGVSFTDGISTVPKAHMHLSSLSADNSVTAHKLKEPSVPKKVEVFHPNTKFDPDAAENVVIPDLYRKSLSNSDLIKKADKAHMHFDTGRDSGVSAEKSEKSLTEQKIQHLVNENLSKLAKSRDTLTVKQEPEEEAAAAEEEKPAAGEEKPAAEEKTEEKPAEEETAETTTEETNEGEKTEEEPAKEETTKEESSTEEGEKAAAKEETAKEETKEDKPATETSEAGSESDKPATEVTEVAAPLTPQQAAKSAMEASEAAKKAALTAEKAANAVLKSAKESGDPAAAAAVGSAISAGSSESDDALIPDEAGKEDEGQGEDEAAKQVSHNEKGEKIAGGGQAVAIGLIGSAFLIPITIAFMLDMRSRRPDLYSSASNRGKTIKGRPIRRELTYQLIDNFTAIFVAVLWFKALSAILSKVIPKDYKIVATLSVFFLLYLAVVLALRCSIYYSGKNGPTMAFTIAGCGGHYVAFAAIKCVENIQKNYLEYFDGHIFPNTGHIYKDFAVDFLICCAFTVAVLVTFWVMQKVSKYLRLSVNKSFRESDGGKRLSDHEKHHHHHLEEEEHELVEETESDMYALTLSYVATQGVRYLIMGHYPAHHLLMQREDSSSTIIP